MLAVKPGRSPAAPKFYLVRGRNRYTFEPLDPEYVRITFDAPRDNYWTWTPIAEARRFWAWLEGRGYIRF
jgi:hypothetical protein